MKNNRNRKRLVQNVLLAALSAGCLLESNCLQIWQREIEVLTYPEVNSSLFYDSILFNSQIGRALIKFWNIPVF